MTIKEYIASIDKQWRTGSATEHSYRGQLQQYVQNILGKDFTVVNEPSRSECGAPDYAVLRKGQPVFYIEAKDIDNCDLDGRRAAGNKEQFTRYKQALDLVVFTDYLDFHFYENGEWVENIRIGELHGDRIAPLPDAAERLASRLRSWGQASVQRITSASRLAEVMAAKARLLRHVTEEAMQRLDRQNYADNKLAQLFASFQSVLIHDLTIDKFADMYAQTIVYGLFAARLHDDTPEDFSRAEAVNLIPKSNPFLRQLFNNVAGIDLDDRVAWIVDDLVDTFAATDVSRVMRQYGKNDQRNDPMVHFYEDFLTAYDPKLRRDMGVWYTPKPVVQFIVRAVDQLLQSEFGLKQGLADTSKTEITVPVEQSHDRKSKDGMKHQKKTVGRVQVLDVATGTGTFLAEVVSLIHRRVAQRNAGLWQSYVDSELKPRLNGFELMMAPYTIAHLKLDMLLQQTGYEQRDDRRLNIFLTDSLVEPNGKMPSLFDVVAAETAAADRVKQYRPVMCVIGNPPYNGASQNKGEWIMRLMDDYKTEPGGELKLKERNPKWLNDDYVKFIRMAQHFVEKNKQGIIGYINPHGFLDNPTFRGMRWQLLHTFDAIYTLNLHGNTRSKEACPDGSKDENVFNIEQGVSINLFVKTGKKQADALGKVYYADLYGLRTNKCQTLSEKTLQDVGFNEVTPEAPMYFFVPKNMEGIEEYESGFGVQELFVENSVGVVTTKDAFLVCDSREEVARRIGDLIIMSKEELYSKYKIKDTRDWILANAKEDVGKNVEEEKIIHYDYRPFDKRYLYYTGITNGVVARPRYQIQRHFLQPSNEVGHQVALRTSRQQTIGQEWALVSIVDSVSDLGYISTVDKGNVFPLYIYKESFGHTERIPNFNPAIYDKVSEGLGLRPEPEALFHYIYAVLHSPRYRERFQEFLKTDFPRIPYPTDRTRFEQLAAVGEELADLHLLRGADQWPLEAGFPVTGTNVVEQAQWRDGRVYINDAQYFDGITAGVWQHPVGGYQPMQKWLKDRRGRTLSFADVTHYEQMAYALQRTAALMRQLNDEKFA